MRDAHGACETKSAMAGALVRYAKEGVLRPRGGAWLRSCRIAGFHADEGAMIQDFRLKPAAGISGVVLLPDRRRGAGVQVVLGTQENRPAVRNGVVQRDSNAETTITGPDGRLTVPKRDEGLLIVIVADVGFADATSDEFAKTGKLVLRPWGRIEGEVRSGRRPAAYLDGGQFKLSEHAASLSCSNSGPRGHLASARYRR